LQRAKAIFVVVAAWVAAIGACGGSAKESSGPARATSITAAPEIVEITYLEAERSFGRARIADLTSHRDPTVRAHAVRALGRVSDDEALDLLDQLVDDEDTGVRAAAIRALGVAGATRRAALLGQAYSKTEDAGLRAAALEAIGRVGGPAQLRLLTAAVNESTGGLRATAAIAIGNFGRRELSLDNEARNALFAATKNEDAYVRFGVAYALAKEHKPPKSEAAERALQVLAKDGDAEVRATAVAGLNERQISAGKTFVAALEDKDWRVRLEAARALAADHASLRNREFLATWLAREWAVLASLEGLAGARIHVVVEGLRALAGSAHETAVQAAAVGLFDATQTFLEAESLPEKRLGAGHVNCLAAAMRVRGGAPLRFLWDCGAGDEGELPLHIRRGLAAEVLGAGFGGKPAERVDKLRELAQHKDPRIRAAVAASAGPMSESSDADMRGAAMDLLRTALDDSAAQVAGAAAAAIEELSKSKSEAAAEAHKALIAAVLARASKVSEAETELRLSMLSTLKKVAEARPLCLTAHSDPNAAVRELARKCLRELNKKDPGAGTPSRAPVRPPVKPASILGKLVVWKLETTRGEIEISLDPDTAPWSVAVLVKLTDDKHYDGLLWHRVVPGFVSQTGDPGGSGWGGPGFLLPGEPSAGKFVRGSVGIADSGKDTGGSQWFVTHARSPHLDGRYTLVGKVTKGQSVLESLVVGDRLLRASAEVTQRPAPQK